MGPSLLLASNSPRRRELLTEAGFEFEIWTPDVTEKFDVDLTLRELTAFNAVRKAMAAARSYPEKIVLAADTLVAIHDHVLGKPAGMPEAVAMLRRLSGQTHEVCTSVFVCHLLSGKSTGFSEIARVRFRRLSRAGIDRYLARINPLDKAGAYAIQEQGELLVEQISGSFSNVIGLPLERLNTALDEWTDSRPDM